ncbi:MAG: transcriptional regulator [Cyanobacteria bacterium P01_E01_bin.42]
MKPKTKSYREYLIESLKDPQEAALYLWAILQEENPEPELLISTLQDVAEARGKSKMSPQNFELHAKKLEQLQAKKLTEVIPALVSWLKELDLTLTVVSDRDEIPLVEPVIQSSEISVKN